MWYLVRYLRRRRWRSQRAAGRTIGAEAKSGPVPREGGLAPLLWYRGAPMGALAVWLAAPSLAQHTLGLVLIVAALCATVLVAVHHAEVVAHRVGEPFGTLILALAVTVIEVALIVSLMLSGGAERSALARDTVFATVMIVCNGGIGLCLLTGTMRHFVLEFRVEGANPALTVIIALTTLTLILPTLTTTTAGPTFAPSQLVFAGVMSLVLYAVFVFVQTVRHRDYFLHVATGGNIQHAPPPATSTAVVSLVFLLMSLVAVVGLAKAMAPAVQDMVGAAGAPAAVVGIIIALLVLAPETWAAMRAAMRNRMQTSLNLLLGSALATIGLTIPAVAVISLTADLPLQLGLPPKETALLVLTFLVSITTLAGGRATVLHGIVHLVLFATFLFLAVVP